MLVDQYQAIWEELKAGQILSDAQLAELSSQPAAAANAEALVAELVKRRWLTTYQAEEVVAGRGQALVLGPYLLLDLLGQGGMGQVFKARHRLMKREVAIKFIRPELLANRDALHRFQREIQALSQVTHPNIVIAHDAAQIGDRIYLVMEYVEGATLDRLVHQLGPLPWAQASDTIRQAALGLQHAQERGLVHRDIKPGNLILAQQPGAGSGIVKILDLGLALFRPETDTPCSDGSALTSIHTVMGTPDFMAPEQAANTHQADIRADIYSLGCTLYFLLTGRPPFAGGTAMEKILLHQQAQPLSVQVLRPDVPSGLATIVTTLLAKRPQDRYQTPQEAAAALIPFCQDSLVTPCLAAPRIIADAGLLPPLETLVTSATEGTEALPIVAPSTPAQPNTRYRMVGAALLMLLVCALSVALVYHLGYQEPDNYRERKKVDPRPEPRMLLVVGKDGQAKYTSIADAVKDAPVGGPIQVSPGVYTESLVIDREIEIIGEGNPGEVIIEVSDGSCLHLSADKALIRNVTFRGKTGPMGGEFNAVKISHGRAVLEDCRITGATGSGVVIVGTSAHPTLRRCVVEANTRAGLFVTRGAQPTIESCRFEGNQVGVHVSEKGNPVLRNCQIGGNREFGVFLFQQGESRIDEGSVIARNKIGVGIQEEGSYLILQNCTIQTNETSGLIVQKGGKAKLFDCTLLENGEFGVLLTDKGSNAILESCTIQKNVTGVRVRNQAHGRIEECDLRNNRSLALQIDPTCEVVERKNKK